MEGAAVVYAAIAFLVAYVIWLLVNESKLKEKLSGFPYRHKGGWPLIGNTLELAVRPKEFFWRLTAILKEHTADKLLILWLGMDPKVLVYRADLVEVIHRSSKHSAKSSDYRFLHPWLSTGLLTSDGEKWLKRRKLITPTFHFSLLGEFVPVINHHCAEMIHKLMAKVDGEDFDVFHFVTLNALDNIAECAMGVSVNALEDEESDYVHAVYFATEAISQRMRTPWYWHDWFYYNCISEGRQFTKSVAYLHGYTDNVIAQRKAEFEMQGGGINSSDRGKKRLAFLDMLIEASDGGKTLSDLDIREEVDTFMFEGHDTTAAAVGWAIFQVGMDRQVQDKLHAELREVFGSDNRDADLKDLAKLSYLEKVIKETLRLMPSVPFYARTLSEDIHYEGSTLPSGMDAIVVPAQLHRDTAYFPDPDTFNPENFSLEKTLNRHPYAYIPFSAGPRNCVGQKFAMMELKLVLSSLFRHFAFETISTLEEIEPVADLILRPSKGVRVKLTHAPRE